jgi:hypothetical protein
MLKYFFRLISIFVIAFTGINCCDSINEDGQSPSAAIKVIFKDRDGREVTKRFSTEMNRTGAQFSVEIPTNTDYKLEAEANDAGCIKSLTLEGRQAKIALDTVWMGSSFFTLYKFAGNPKCPKKHIEHSHDVLAHNGDLKVYICTAEDYISNGNSLTIWVRHTY